MGDFGSHIEITSIHCHFGRNPGSKHIRCGGAGSRLIINPRIIIFGIILYNRYALGT